MGDGDHRPRTQRALASCRYGDPEDRGQQKARWDPPENLGGWASPWGRRGWVGVGEKRQGDPGWRKRVCKGMGAASNL